MRTDDYYLTVSERGWHDIPDTSSVISFRRGSLSDQSYAKKLYLSRSAKIKRWCSLRVTRTKGDDESSPVSRRRTARISRYREHNRPMPTILVTSDEGAGLGDDYADKRSDDLHGVEEMNIVNGIPWVDWLEEYKVLKAAEIARRRSCGSISTATEYNGNTGPCVSADNDAKPVTNTDQQPPVDHRLSSWWNTVKANVEHYAFPKRFHLPEWRRHSSQEASNYTGPTHKPHSEDHASSTENRHETSGKPNMSSRPSFRRCMTSVDENDLKAAPMGDAASIPEHSATSSSETTRASPAPSVVMKPSPKRSSTRIGYQFHNPVDLRISLFARLGRIFGTTNNDNDERSSNMRVQSTIRSRLQYAKEACDAEMRYIIDGLNEYVERGLQYVEDMDEMLERGVHNISSGEESQSDGEDDESVYGTEQQGEQARNISDDASERLRVPETAYESRLYRAAASDSRKRGLITDLDDIEEQEEADEVGHHSQVNTPVPEEMGHTASVEPSTSTSTPSHVNNMLTLISEDSYLPTPFILTLQDLISLAQSVMDTPLDVFLEHSNACAELVSRIQSIGSEWDRHPEWPCREWYVRLLLGVAALNRVLDWWEAERGFWASSWGGQSSAPLSDTDGGGTTDLESVSGVSRADDGEYGDGTRPGRQRLFTAGSEGRDDLQTTSSQLADQATAANDETISVCTQDKEQQQFESASQLQQAAEESQNMTTIMELSLGTTAIQYVSPVWLKLVG